MSLKKTQASMVLLMIENIYNIAEYLLTCLWELPLLLPEQAL